MHILYVYDQCPNVPIPLMSFVMSPPPPRRAAKEANNRQNMGRLIFTHKYAYDMYIYMCYTCIQIYRQGAEGVSEKVENAA